MTISRARLLTMGIVAGGSVACSGVSPSPSATPTASSGVVTTGDTAGRALVPPGYGTMHQDDLAFHITAQGLLIRAVPLDEAVIRLLTPDSYRAMRDLQQGSRAQIDAIARRYGGRGVSVWLVSFYGVEPEARFTPLDLNVTSAGRDFRPYDVIPLTVGFSEQRLRQRETQNALYVYDGDIDLNQSVVVTYEGIQDTGWDQILQRIERERAMIRARAGNGGR